MACIRLDTINVDNELLSIKDGRVLITNTDLSINTNTGAFVVKGGVGIYCTSDALSSTSGGALTVGGGLGIKGKGYFGDDIILDSSLSTLTVNGIVYPRLFLDSIVNKKFFLSLDGIHQQFVLTPSKLILDTSMIINNGLNINTNMNSSSVTNGGSLTVGGGGSIYGDLYIGESLFVSGGSVNTNQIYSDNTLDIYTNDNLNFTTSKINIDSDVLNINKNNVIFDDKVYFNVPVISMDNVDFRNNVLINNDLHVLRNVTIDENLFVDDNIQVENNIHLTNDHTSIYNYNDYIFFNANNGYVFESTASSLSIYSGLLHLNDYSFYNENSDLNIISSIPSLYLNLYPNLNGEINNVSNLICLYNVNECFKIGYDSEKRINVFSIEVTGGSKNVSDFVLRNHNGDFVLRSDGSLFSSSVKSSLNSTTASCIFNGGISVNCNANASSVTEGGSLTLNGGLGILKDVHIGGDIYLGSNSMNSETKSTSSINIANDLNLCYNNEEDDIRLNIFKNTELTSGGGLFDVSLYSLGKSRTDQHFECLNINNLNKEISFCSSCAGDGILQSIQIFTGDSHNQLFVGTNGNVGINTNIPEFSLDVSGSIRGDSLYGNNLFIDQNLECSDLFIKKDIKVSNDLFVDHNISLQNDLWVDGLIYCKNTDDNAFVVDGGVKIAKDINIGGSIISKSEGVFNKLTSDGVLTSHGEVNIKSTLESTSYHTGALTVGGGVGVDGSLHAGGDRGRCYVAPWAAPSWEQPG